MNFGWKVTILLVCLQAGWSVGSIIDNRRQLRRMKAEFAKALGLAPEVVSLGSVESAWALKHALRLSKSWTGGRMRLPRSERIGRTASWPASLLFVRFRTRPSGLWLRLGERCWWFTWMPL